jgi:Rrf2 family protein
MLKLTKRADYGMMAMRYLAEHAAEGKAHSARDIADAYNIPLPVLAKTLQTLARAELVASQHGAMGGYALTRPAKTISTLEVIAAFDGSPVITSCTTIHGTCEMVQHCTVKEPLQRLNESIRAVLHNTSVADLTPVANASELNRSEILVSIHY